MNAPEKLIFAIVLIIIALTVGTISISTMYSKRIDREIAVMKNEAYLKCLEILKGLEKSDRWLPSCLHG